MSNAKYAQGADGKIYENFGTPEKQEWRQIKAEGLEVVGGQLVPIRDKATLAQQRDPRSSDEFLNAKFKQVLSENPKDQKQRVLRQQRISQMVEEAVLSRPKDVHGPNIRRVTDEEFMEMRKDPEFESLAKYQHKLVTPSGKVVRPVMSGEVGVYRGKICVLEDAEKFYGAGATLLGADGRALKKDNNGPEET